MNKKTYILTVILYLSSLIVQAQDWVWAKSIGGDYSDVGNKIITDSSGNVYVLGDYGSTVTFGTTTLTNAGSVDMFIVKYDNSGNVLWVRSAGGTEFDKGNSIAIDANGNIYVTGCFGSSTITFGTTILTKTTSTGFFTDFFIVKYDNDGNVLWAKSSGKTGVDIGSGITIDNSGNAYVTGYFYSSTITFGTITLTNTSSDGSSSDLFIVKYDSNGNTIWAKSIGGTSMDIGYNISTDCNGYIYVAGYYSSSSITFGQTVLTNSGGCDIFIVKYDESGNTLWAKGTGGTFDDYNSSIVVDNGGNVYITGRFSSPSITFGESILTNEGDMDMFIMKYDENGNELWAKSAGGTYEDRGNDIALDANGNVYIIGGFNSYSVTFNKTTLTNTNYKFTDLFIVKYDESGNSLWAKSAIGAIYDIANSIAIDKDKNIYLTGYYNSHILTFNTTTLTNVGNADIFLAKFKEIPVNSISISGGTNIITVGGKLLLTATTNIDATNSSVTWSIDGTAAVIDSITGLVTAISDGSVTIIATANDGSGVSQSITFTICGQTEDLNKVNKKPCIIKPVPVIDIATIESNEMITSFEVYSYAGLKIIDDNSGVNKVNVSELSKEVYIIKILFVDGSICERLIIK